jgi:cytochrome c55X
MKKAASVLSAALTVGALTSWVGAPAFAQSTENFDPSKANDGKKVYTQFCARCHGLNMAVTGNSFFDLRTLKPEEKLRFMNSVKNGVRAMPAWGDNLKTEEYELLWSYVMTNRKK